MKGVLDTDELPEHIHPLRTEGLLGLKRNMKPYTTKALSEIKRAVSNNLDDKRALDVAAGLME